MACAFQGTPPGEDEPPAARPIHQSCQLERFAKHLRRFRDNLFVFLDRADVEATNYPAEQDIRIAVVNRKTCGGGNRTAKGARPSRSS